MKLNGWVRHGIRGAVIVASLLLASTTAEAGLTLVKSHVDENGGELCVGDTVLFTIRATADTAENFRISDIISSKWYSFWEVVQTAGISCSTNLGALIPTGPNGTFCASQVIMNAGDSFDFQYRATVRDNCLTPQDCQAATARDTNLDEFDSNLDCVDYTCGSGCPGANLFATKTYTGPATPIVGDTLSWTVTIENLNATSADTNIRVTDALDAMRITAGQFLNFSRPPDILLPGPNLDATWNAVAGGETITFDVTGIYANCQPGIMDGVCNQVTIASDTIQAQELDGERRSHPPGDPAERATCVVATPGGSAMLTTPVSKSVTDLNGPPTRMGDTVEYTVTFENAAYCPTANGSFTDTLDPGLTLNLASVAITPPGAGVDNSTGNRVQVDNLVVPARNPTGPATVAITFQAVVNAATGRICNEGTYIFGAAAPQPTEEVCFDAGLVVAATKTHDDPNGDGTLRRGQTLTYTIRLENTGPSALNDVHVTDALPPGVDFVSLIDDAGGTVIQMGPTAVEVSSINLPPGAAGARTVVFSVRENGLIAGGSDICNSSDVSSGGLSGVAGPACIQVVDLGFTVAKSHDDPNGDGSLNRGQMLRYTIRIENVGTSALSDVHVLDTLPAGVSFVSLDDNAGGVVVQMGPAAVEIDAIPVVPGVANAKTVVFTVMEDGTEPDMASICNLATVTSGGTPQSDDACVTVRDATAPCTVVPGKVNPLHAVRMGNDAVFSWPMEASSSLGYRLYSVDDKTLIASADGAGPSPPVFLRCQTTAIGLLTCTHTNAIDPTNPELHYQLLGVCNDGTPMGVEGSH